MSIFDLTPEPRRRIMRAIKGRRNKTTEGALATLLRRAGIVGWRRQVPFVGRPDFVWRKSRLVVFVDGCFWHGCPVHYRRPAVNSDFWGEKLKRNRARDRRVTRILREQGWHVLRIWECQVPKQKTLTRISNLLREAD